MKRIIKFILVIILGFVLTGCSNDDSKESNNELNQEENNELNHKENLYDNLIVKSDPAEVSLNIDEISCSLKYSAKGLFGYNYNEEGKLSYLREEFVISKSQLVELCNEYNINTFNENNSKNSSGLDTLLQSFDECYFSDKNIIIFTFWTGNMCKNNITNCSIIDGTLNFDVIESYKEDDYFYTLESYLWLVILEVDKLETLGINNLSINYKKGS